MDEPHIPLPTLWPLGFAVGIAVALVGLIVDPMIVSPIGAAVAVVFGVLWARDATAEMRGHVVTVEPETHELAHAAVAIEAAPAESTKMPRSRFLEAATLGLGGVIGGLVTVPVAGFALLPGFLSQKRHEVDLGPVADFPEGKWFITTFMTDPAESEVSRRTAFIRNNGLLGNVPSFTIISNRCAHLGCPVQANGPTGAILGEKNVVEHTKNGPILLRPVVPAGFGCPCHGGQYDTEGNRTAGPPVRGLDRYAFDIKDGRLILLSTYSVTHVDGTGAQAKIHKYKLAGPGEHIDGIEQLLYPLQPPHH
ncbi:MAG TPA: Rieske 2Fe-2S domain-containing protein [Gaiellaceae bacterium]|nr:Rieske 2Fe-2S domain-containing protein [Gaiellaceae bacterium]